MGWRLVLIGVMSHSRDYDMESSDIYYLNERFIFLLFCKVEEEDRKILCIFVKAIEQTKSYSVYSIKYYLI